MYFIIIDAYFCTYYNFEKQSGCPPGFQPAGPACGGIGGRPAGIPQRMPGLGAEWYGPRAGAAEDADWGDGRGVPPEMCRGQKPAVGAVPGILIRSAAGFPCAGEK